MVKIFPSENERVVTAAIIACVTGVLLGLYGGSKIVNPDILLTGLATLIAAFLGAFSAFYLQERKEKRNERKRNAVAGNITIFNITRKINLLTDFRNQFINPVRDRPTIFLEMQPTLHVMKNNTEFDFKNMAFLLESDDPNILGELDVIESRFQSVLDAINERSQLHLRQVQPILENSGFNEGGNYTFGQIEKMLGSRLFVTMKSATTQIVESVDFTLKSLEESENKLSGMMRRLYPKETIISLLPPGSE